MYTPAWILLIIVSLGAGLAAFVWGVSSGQFADQDRARYLPFAAENPGRNPVPKLSGGRVQKYFYLTLLAVALAFFAVAAAMAFYYTTRG